jgi:predicted ester cyclase
VDGYTKVVLKRSRTKRPAFEKMESDLMAREENIAVQERFAEGVNGGNFDVFDEVVDPNVVDHDPTPDQGSGPEGYKQLFGTRRAAFPDLEVTPEHMTATDEDVALAYTVTGTYEGEFREGQPAPAGLPRRLEGMIHQHMKTE